MRFERAIILGVFSTQLGIDHDARIEILPVKNGLKIWDLDSANQYILGLSGETLDAMEKPLPTPLRALLAESDTTLQSRLSSGKLRKWSDERETILSELKYRGVRAEDIQTPVAQFSKWDRRREGFLKSLDLSRLWQRIGFRDSRSSK